MSEVDQLAALFERTHELLQRHAARAVDATLVVRNWLYGWYLEEFERGSASRADIYGKRLMEGLADRLKARGLRGCSVVSLNRFRRFYREHPEIRSRVWTGSPEIGSTLLTGSPEIGSTLLTESSPPLEVARGAGPSATPLPDGAPPLTRLQITSLLNAFPLGWSHYIELMTLDDADERRFYEIEAAANPWSVRELQRQIASSLYQRLALSRDKAEIRRLATEGQVVERAADLIKDPLVLEFLGLAERPHYTEDELESAIIDQLYPLRQALMQQRAFRATILGSTGGAHGCVSSSQGGDSGRGGAAAS